jgi:predicted transcriptional regulator of viral defense system
MINGSTLHQVFTAVRGHGVTSLDEIAERTGNHAHQIAPVAWWLAQRGWLAEVGDRYVEPRLARWAQ